MYGPAGAAAIIKMPRTVIVHGVFVSALHKDRQEENCSLLPHTLTCDRIFKILQPSVTKCDHLIDDACL